MYKYVSCNDNFTFFVSHTLTSSTFRIDDDDDDGTVDWDINRSICAHLDGVLSIDSMLRLPRSMRQDYAVTSIVVRNFYMRRRTYDDLDVQELICCQYQSSHQGMR